MSDFFGIGQAIKGSAMVYFQASRATGRTLSMVNSLKDGDRVCFATQREADRVKRLCKERGADVDCVVIAPERPDGIFERGPSHGRTIFDHSWVEKFYLGRIEDAGRAIDNLEMVSGGYGETHRETKIKAREVAKWRF